MSTTIYPGTQPSGTLKISQGYPGDISSAVANVDLYADGKFASTTLKFGSACFLSGDGNQVVNARSSSTIANAPIAGFVPRNKANETMSWADTENGYASAIGIGSQLPIYWGGDFLANVKGIDSAGEIDHIPTAGEYIFVSETDGSFASCVTSTAITGYVLAQGWTVSKTGLTSYQTLDSDTSLCQISGILNRSSR